MNYPRCYISYHHVLAQWSAVSVLWRGSSLMYIDKKKTLISSVQLHSVQFQCCGFSRQLCRWRGGSLLYRELQIFKAVPRIPLYAPTAASESRVTKTFLRYFQLFFPQYSLRFFRWLCFNTDLLQLQNSAVYFFYQRDKLKWKIKYVQQN